MATPAALKRQIPAAAVIRPSMQIPPRGGHAAMAQRRLHRMDRRTAVERVRGVRMAQPVRRYGSR